MFSPPVSGGRNRRTSLGSSRFTAAGRMYPNTLTNAGDCTLCALLSGTVTTFKTLALLWKSFLFYCCMWFIVEIILTHLTSPVDAFAQLVRNPMLPTWNCHVDKRELSLVWANIIQLDNLDVIQSSNHWMSNECHQQKMINDIIKSKDA